MAIKLKKKSFVKTYYAIRSDISFAKGDQYTVFWLKYSKTNMDYFGIQIILAATGKRIHLVVALRQLFQTDFQPTYALLLCLGFEAFSCQNNITVLRKKLMQAGIKDTGFLRYNFCKIAI